VDEVQHRVIVNNDGELRSAIVNNSPISIAMPPSPQIAIA
jgi:hypothetical protein